MTSVAALVAFFTEAVLLAALRAWTKRTKTGLDDTIVRALHPGIMVVFFVAASWMALSFMPLDLSPAARAVLDRLGQSLFLVGATLVVARLIAGLLRLPAQKDPRWFPLSTVGVRISVAAIWVMALLILMRQNGIEITPVLATLGLATLAVGLALQPTLANFFAGIWIQTGQNLRPGHFIRLENQKLDGFIEEVGWRTTRIRTLPGNMIIIPNDSMAQAIITNFSLPADKMGTNITIVTGFEADPAKIVKILLEEARNAGRDSELILSDPAPAARLNRAVDNGWEFWCGFWVAHYWDSWNAQGHMFERLRRRFLEEGIRMPLPIEERYQVPGGRPDVARSIVSASPTANGHSSVASMPREPEDLPDSGDGVQTAD